MFSMFWAMALKELRETAWLMLLMLGACVVLFSGMLNEFVDLDFLPRISSDSQCVPFVEDGVFTTRFWWGCVMLTLALGFRQTLGESIQHTYPFLLHRPAGRRWLVGMKLFIGLGLYLACGASVIVAYGLWAATPGTHASPFEWSMTVPTWVSCFAMTPLYLGAFLSGIRPGRWFGTRLFPLLAAVVVTLAVVTETFGLDGGSILPGVSVVFAADVWMIAAILFVAQTRDYS